MKNGEAEPIQPLNVVALLVVFAAGDLELDDRQAGLRREQAATSSSVIGDDVTWLCHRFKLRGLRAIAGLGHIFLGKGIPSETAQQLDVEQCRRPATVAGKRLSCTHD